MKSTYLHFRFKCRVVWLITCTLGINVLKIKVQSKRFMLNLGSGALSGKMLLIRIVENNKIDDYFRTG